MISNSSLTISCLFLALILTSCLSIPMPKVSNSPLIAQSLAETPSSLVAPSCKVPTPRPGRASLCGILRSTYMTPSEIPKTAFYLTRAVENRHLFILTGPKPEAGDIQGTSDEEGKISIEEINPGHYYLVVWAPYNWIIAVKSAEDLTPRLFIIEPNRQYNLGIIYVPWP